MFRGPEGPRYVRDWEGDFFSYVLGSVRPERVVTVATCSSSALTNDQSLYMRRIWEHIERFDMR